MKTTARLATIEVDGLRKNRVVVERLEPMFCPPSLEREVPSDPQQERT